MFSNVTKLLRMAKCSRNYSFLAYNGTGGVSPNRKDEDVPSVYRNLKIFCETAPWPSIHMGTVIQNSVLIWNEPDAVWAVLFRFLAMACKPGFKICQVTRTP